MPRVALAVPDVVGELAELGDPVHHDAHGATPLELDLHALQAREGALDAWPQLGGDVPRVAARVVGAATEQQAAVGGGAVVIEDEAAIVDRQPLRVDLPCQLAQRPGGNDSAHGREDHPLELPAFELVVDIAGKQNLLRLDPSLAGNHRRPRAVDDIQHLGMFEDQRAEAGRRPGLADAQVERVQVHVAGVLQRAAVQLGLQVGLDAGLVQQDHLVAHAAAHRLLVGGLQLAHVAGLHRRVQVAMAKVAGDAVLLHPLADDLVAAPAQVPDEVLDLGAQPLAHLLVHRRVAGQAAGDLAAVAPAGAPADAMGLDQGYLVATLGQFDRRGDAGEAAADDGDVDRHRAQQGRIVGFLVERGGVVGRRAFRGRTGMDCCVHRVFLVPVRRVLPARRRMRAGPGSQAWVRYQRQSCSPTSPMNCRYSARFTAR